MVKYVLGTTESIHGHNQREARLKETNTGRWLWRAEEEDADRELLVSVDSHNGFGSITSRRCSIWHRAVIDY